MEAGKPWEGSWEDLNLEDLYKSPWFFGELSEEKAKEILVEAMQNDSNSKEKSILFLKTVLRVQASLGSTEKNTLPLSTDEYGRMILMASLNLFSLKIAGLLL